MAGGEQQYLASMDQSSHQMTIRPGPSKPPPPSQGTAFAMGYPYGAHPNYSPNDGNWSPYVVNPPPHPYPSCYRHPGSTPNPYFIAPNMYGNHQYHSGYESSPFNAQKHAQGSNNVSQLDGTIGGQAYSATTKIFRKIKEIDAASDRADDAVLEYVSQKVRNLAHRFM